MGMRFLFQIVPFSIGFRVCEWLGWVAYYIVFWERKRALTNIHLALGDKKKPQDLRAIARRMFINIGYSMAELIYAQQINKEYLSKHITLVGTDNLENLESQVQGSIAITAHFGNWELMGAYFVAVTGTKFAAIFRKSSSDYVNRMVSRIRDEWKITTIPRGDSASGILRTLRSGYAVVVLGDQDTKGEGTFVQFFNRQAYTQVGPAWLALRLGVPIFPVFIVRSPENPRCHTIYMEKPLSFELTEDRETNVQLITQLYTERIESFIRKYPDQWMWIHRRWKTQPPPVEGINQK